MASTALFAMAACGSDNESTDESDTTTAPTEAESDTTTATTEAEAETTIDDTTVETTGDTTPDTTEDTTSDTTEDTSGSTTDDTTAASTDGTGVTPDAYEVILRGLLLTAEEIGPTFSESEFVGGDGTTPCGVDVESQHPTVATAGTQLNSDDPELVMVQEIKAYETEEEAAAAFALATTGFDCGSGDGFEFGDVTDVSAELGTEAFALTVASDVSEGAMFVALYSDAIVIMQFQQRAGAAPPVGIDDPTTIAIEAIDKIKTSLES
jgi:hypothetical protein